MGSHSYYDYDRGNPLNWLLACFLFGVFLMCLIFSSCNTTKRMTGKIGRLGAKNPEALHNVCDMWFKPVIVQGGTKTEIRTEYLPGETRTEYDTVTVQLEGKTVRVPCPGTKVRVDTMRTNTHQSDTVIIDRTKEIDQFKKEAVAKDLKIDQLKKRNKILLFIAGGLVVFATGLTLLRFFVKKWTKAPAWLTKILNVKK